MLSEKASSLLHLTTNAGQVKTEEFSLADNKILNSEQIKVAGVEQAEKPCYG